MNPKPDNEPHVRRESNLRKPQKGWLKNGNPPGDLSQVKRCSARSKRHGGPCSQPAMANGKCRFHGGKSTGPRTPEGIERSREANWRHGLYCAEARQERKRLQELFREARSLFPYLEGRES